MLVSLGILPSFKFILLTIHMILSNIIEKVKQNREDILLIIIIFLACLLVFSIMWIILNNPEKQPLNFQYE